MQLDAEACYRALRTRDARFDGRFFTAVRSTGVYCRPICPAPTPKRENCLFLPCAAAAQEAGFRPCLRCRPEASPGTPAWLGTSATVTRALRLIGDGALDGGSVEELALRLGIGERHLRRLFLSHLGASPLAVAQTRRLLFAVKLIDETSLPISEVAFAAGYSSVRRFNDAIARTYGRSPSALRGKPTKRERSKPTERERSEPTERERSEPTERERSGRAARRSRAKSTGDGRAARRSRAKSTGADRAEIRLQLAFRPPLDWSALLAHFAARATPGVECVEGGAYRRSVRLGEARGVVSVEAVPEANHLLARIRLDSAARLIEVAERLRRCFDLGADPIAIAAQLRRDPKLRPRIAARPGLRVPGAWDGFELSVRAILGQQVSVRGATTLAGRLAARYGEPLGRESSALSRLFPTPEALAGARLADLGLPGRRAEAIRALARAVAEGELALDGSADPEATQAALRELPGVGAWTVQVIAMRALREPDAMPAADLGLRRALGDPGPASERALLRAAEAWRPWRAYACALLWSEDAAAARPRRRAAVSAATRAAQSRLRAR